MRRYFFPVMTFVLAFALVWQLKFAQRTEAAPRPNAVAIPAPVDERASIRTEGRVVAYPNAEVEVGTDIEGTIVYLPVQEREHVTKGQVIAELRSDDLRASMNQAQARVNESEADIHLYEIELERAKKLYTEKVGTLQTQERAQRDLEAAEARLATAQAEVKEWQAKIDKTHIVAPISGTVITRQVAPGETVKDGAVLMTIADLSRVRVEAEVDEFDAGRIRRGSSAKITAEGYTGQAWKSHIEEIPNSVVPRNLRPEDPGKPVDTRVLLVKLAFDGQTPLKLGQRVQVEILPEQKQLARK